MLPRYKMATGYYAVGVLSYTSIGGHVETWVRGDIRQIFKIISDEWSWMKDREIHLYSGTFGGDSTEDLDHMIAKTGKKFKTPSKAVLKAFPIYENMPNEIGQCENCYKVDLLNIHGCNRCASGKMNPIE